MLGKKLVDVHKDKIDALSDNIEEGVHTAGEVLNQASSVTGIRMRWRQRTNMTWTIWLRWLMNCKHR